MLRIYLIALLSISGFALHAAELPEAVRHVLRPDTIAVIAIDLQQIDLSTTTEAAVDQADIPAETATRLRAFAAEANLTRDRMLAIGLKEMYVTFNIGDMMGQRPLRYVFPAEQPEAAAEGLQALMKEGRANFLRRLSITTVPAGIAVGEEAAAAPEESSAELAARFAELLGADDESPISGVVYVNEDVRRVLKETFPTLPDKFGGLTGSQIAAALKSLTLKADLPPDGSLSLTLTPWDADALPAVANSFAAVRQFFPPELQHLEPQIRDGILRLQLRDLDGAMAPIAEAYMEAMNPARSATYRMQTMNDLKNIGLAFHNYHSEYGHFPPFATVDEDGRQLLSWRVHILPYLDNRELYDQFHLEEPWDSEHNLKLLEKMPGYYRTPGAIAGGKPGMTTYVLPLMPGSPFGNDGPPPQIKDFKDGVSNTLLVVTTTEENAVPWTKPADLEVDPENPKASLLGGRTEGISTLFADGSARYLSAGIDPQVLKAMLTHDGGERVD